MRVWQVVRLPGVPAPFVLSFLARLPVAMVPIGMVIYVHQLRGDYVVAGVVAAGFTVGAALGTPWWGALTDRCGQTRVLAPLSLAAAVVLAAFTALVATPAASAVVVAAAVVVGAVRPPIPAAMRSSWKVLVHHPRQLHAAFSLEAVVGEVVFITGPLLLSVVVLLGWPSAPLLVAAGLQAIGGLGYSLTPVARGWHAAVPTLTEGCTRGPSPISQPAVLAVLAVTLLLGVGFGVFNTALTASATSAFARPELVGVLFMAVAGGSAVGGVVYGSRSWPGQDRQRLLVSTGAFTLGLATLAVVLAAPHPQVHLAVVVLAVMGAPIAAGLVMRSNLIDDHASADRLNEAQSWLNTAHSAGSAAGAVVAGLLVQGRGAAAAMGAAALAVGGGWLVSLAAQRVWSAHGEVAQAEVVQSTQPALSAAHALSVPLAAVGSVAPSRAGSRRRFRPEREPV